MPSQELLRPYGHEVDLAWYMENVHGKNDREVFSHLFPDATEDELQRLSVQKDACFREKVRHASRQPASVSSLLGCSL